MQLRIAVVAAALGGCTAAGPAATRAGHGATIHNPEPTVEELAAGAFHTCARTRGGTVRCWGMGSGGQIGDGAMQQRDRPVKVPELYDVLQIAAEGNRTCAVRRDGSVWCWGQGASAELAGMPVERERPVQIPEWRGIRQIALAMDHDCAVTRDDRVLCRGQSSRGAIGDGGAVATGPELTPVVRLGPVVEVAVGYAFSCARGPGGEVWCWGWNEYGQCGEPSGRDHLTPVQVQGVSGARQLVAGFDHACALLADGTAMCWGGNTFGQRGDGGAAPGGEPSAVKGLRAASRLAAGQFLTTAILSDGTALGWGRDWPNPASLWRDCADPRAHVSEGQRGELRVIGPREPYCPTPAGLPVPRGALQVVTGQLHACALTDDGQVGCWGSNAYGGVGDGSGADQPAPVPVTW